MKLANLKRFASTLGQSSECRFCQQRLLCGNSVAGADDRDRWVDDSAVIL